MDAPALPRTTDDQRPPPCYHAFLLRLWRDGDEAAGWRASLQANGAPVRLGFADLDQLIAYLQDLVCSSPDPPPDP